MVENWFVQKIKIFQCDGGKEFKLLTIVGSKCMFHVLGLLRKMAKLNKLINVSLM